MIKVQKLHAELKRRLNRIFSSYSSHITVVDIDAYINQAKEILLENYTSIVERNRTIGDRLRSLEIKNEKLKYNSRNDRTFIFDLPLNHYTTLNRYGKAKGIECEVEDSIFINNIFTHKEEESLRNTNVSPSYHWRETFSNEDSLGLHVFHGNVMEVTEVSISYIKYIPDVAFVSGVANGVYINQDGDSISEDKHLQVVDRIIWLKIVDIAEYLIRKNFDENPQTSLEVILFNEKVYINN